MSVIVDGFELSCSISPSRLFKGYIVDADNLVPRVVPIFRSIENEGGQGVGSVKKLTFAIGDYEHYEHYVKHRIDVMDEKNRVFKYTVVEGGDLGDEFEFITNSIKVEYGPDLGSVYINSTAYYLKSHKSEDDPKIQETIKRATEGSKAFFRMVVAHLEENPHEYK